MTIGQLRCGTRHYPLVVQNGAEEATILAVDEGQRQLYLSIRLPQERAILLSLPLAIAQFHYELHQMLNDQFELGRKDGYLRAQFDAGMLICEIGAREVRTMGSSASYETQADGQIGRDLKALIQASGSWEALDWAARAEWKAR